MTLFLYYSYLFRKPISTSKATKYKLPSLLHKYLLVSKYLEKLYWPHTYNSQCFFYTVRVQSMDKFIQFRWNGQSCNSDKKFTFNFLEMCFVSNYSICLHWKLNWVDPYFWLSLYLQQWIIYANLPIYFTLRSSMKDCKCSALSRCDMLCDA